MKLIVLLSNPTLADYITGLVQFQSCKKEKQRWLSLLLKKKDFKSYLVCGMELFLVERCSSSTAQIIKVFKCLED